MCWLFGAGGDDVDDGSKPCYIPTAATTDDCCYIADAYIAVACYDPYIIFWFFGCFLLVIKLSAYFRFL